MRRHVVLWALLSVTSLLWAACARPGATGGGTRPEEEPAAVTPSLAPIPAAMPTGTPSPCPAPLPGSPPNDGHPLRVIYEDGGRLWLWQQGLGSATPLPLSGEAHDAELSPDGRLIAFRRAISEHEDSIWVVGVDGKNERQLASIGLTPPPTHPPQAATPANPVPTMVWIQGTHTLAYYWYRDPATLGPTEYPYGDVHLVDADVGPPRLVVPAGDAWAVSFAPGGAQVAVLTSEGVRLISTSDGRVLFAIPHPTRPEGEICYLQDLLYTPDGRYVIAFAEDSLVTIDGADGTRRDIPLKYTPVGMGGYCVLPLLSWLGQGLQAYVIVPQGPNAVSAVGPKATFDLWKVDVARGEAVHLHTLQGNGVRARLSPDRQWLAYWRASKEDVRELHIAHLPDGDGVLYDRGDLLRFFGWHPDSAHFVYQDATSPLLVGQPGRAASARRSDLGRALVRLAIGIPGTQLFLTLESAPEASTMFIRLYSYDGNACTIGALRPGGRLCGFLMAR